MILPPERRFLITSTGRLFMIAPSTSKSPFLSWTGGKIAGNETLALKHLHNRPLECVTNVPLEILVETQKNFSHKSSMCVFSPNTLRNKADNRLPLNIESIGNV